MKTKKTQLYEALAYVVVIGAPIALGTALGWVAHKLKGEIGNGTNGISWNGISAKDSTK